MDGRVFRWKDRVVARNQPVIQAEPYGMFEETFRHASMGKLVLFLLGHPGRYSSVISGDGDAIADGLNEFGDLVVRPFIAEPYGLVEVLLPVELYDAAEGLEIPFEGSVIFCPGLL